MRTHNEQVIEAEETFGTSLVELYVLLDLKIKKAEIEKKTCIAQNLIYSEAFVLGQLSALKEILGVIKKDNKDKFDFDKLEE